MLDIKKEKEEILKHLQSLSEDELVTELYESGLEMYQSPEHNFLHEVKGATVVMYYSAKCKHCRHFTQAVETKIDGTPSKKKFHICGNPQSQMYTNRVTLKSTGCDMFEL